MGEKRQYYLPKHKDAKMYADKIIASGYDAAEMGKRMEADL